MRDTWISFELDPPDAAEMAQRIARYRESHGWLVGEIDGALAGYVYASPHRERAAYASSCDVAVYVDPAFARRGVGGALYAALIEQLAPRFHAAFAGIALPNEASIGLHGRETHRLVEGDARLVRQSDPGKSGMEARRQLLDQRGIKRAAHPAPGERRIDIDRHIATAGVGRSLAVRRGVGIAGQHAVDLADEPAVALAVPGNPPRHLGCIRRIQLEADPGVAHERRVDFGAAGRVAVPGRANRRGQMRTAVPLALTISIEPCLPITS